MRKKNKISQNKNKNGLSAWVLGSVLTCATPRVPSPAPQTPTNKSRTFGGRGCSGVSKHTLLVQDLSSVPSVEKGHGYGERDSHSNESLHK